MKARTQATASARLFLCTLTFDSLQQGCSSFSLRASPALQLCARMLPEEIADNNGFKDCFCSRRRWSFLS
jgi:hypothetical protein